MDPENQTHNASSSFPPGPSGDAPIKPNPSNENDPNAANSSGLTLKFTPWSMLSLAFSVLGTYSTFAQDLSSGLTNGGPITILWGLVLVTACNLAVALSLGELTSSMPTALGQAYWVHRMWGTRTGRVVSYMCAWINVFGWWTLGASMIAFMTDFTLGLRGLFGQGESSGWLKFVLYVVFTFCLTVVNVVGCRRDRILPWLNNFVGAWFIALFGILSLALLIGVGVRGDRGFQSGTFVFGSWINATGWGDGVVWFTGLVQAAYGLTAFDSVIHMVEEIPSPRTNAPRIIYLAVASGAVTGFIFMVVCLFCIQDVDSVVNASLPFVTLMNETVGRDAATTLLVLFIFNGLGQGVSILTTSSRLTWGFARDGGLPFSTYLSHIDPVWKAPVRAIWVQGIIIALVGVLYLFADTVLEAILSVSTIALTISYGIPIAVLLFITGRENLPPGCKFHLGRWGSTLNYVSLVYCCVTTVFFFFPGSPQPSVAEMNWAIAVFGVMLVIAGVFWGVKGWRTYLRTEEAGLRMLVARELEIEQEEEEEQEQEQERHAVDVGKK